MKKSAFLPQQLVTFANRALDARTHSWKDIQLYARTVYDATDGQVEALGLAVNNY